MTSGSTDSLLGPAGRGRRDWAVQVPVGYRVGSWKVTAPIATGNWGSVYAARRTAPQEAEVPQEAALKFVATRALGPGRSRQLHELAQREVDFSRNTAHPRLVAVLDTLVVEDAARPELDGAVVLVMERAAGNLQDLLDAASGSAPLAEAGRMIGEICDGLDYLHAAGWVHGDLKPANILIMPDDSVRLADFGLVSRVDGTHGYAPPLGSPDYLPPERWSDGLGDNGVAVRPTADIWALGVTAHQIRTGGCLPFTGATAGARTASVQEYASGRTPLRLHAGLDDSWRDFVARCLAPDHAARSAIPIGELAAQARELSDSSATDRRRRRPRRVALAAAAATVLLAVGAGSGWWWLAHDRHSAGDTAARITVYNIEAPCRKQAERLRACSLGLSLDPWKKYAAGNVSEHRIWHGDVLAADCVIYDGDWVADETGVGTSRWYRVRVAEEKSGYAWFPAVRTRKEPTGLPTCSGGSASPGSQLSSQGSQV
jgi:serine/threonine-protein kinase